MFPLDKRLEFIKNLFPEESKIKVEQYSSLTVDFCRQKKADFIVRGLRNPADFEFEKAIAQVNRELSSIETVFFLTAAQTSFISSSMVREIIHHGGDYTKLVPPSVVLS